MANVSSSNGIEKYPKLRFPEFTEPWKKIKIGDIYAERSERGSETSELLSVTMNDGVKRRSELEGKDNSSEDKGNYKVVCTGDMVYNSMRMWQGANGISPYNGIVSPAYTVLTAKCDISNGFFAALFKTHKLISEFCKHSQGMTSDTWNLKYPQIESIKTYIPSVAEQQKIAALIEKVDKRIAIQKELIDSLKKYKRGLLQAVFNQKIRLTKSEENWQIYRIGDLLKICHGKDYKNISSQQKTYPVLGTGGVIDYVDEYICNWPCVLIGRKGTINKPQYMETPFWSVDTLFYSKPNKNQHPKFQFYLFQTINWQKYNEASGVPSLSSSTIEGIKVNVPNYETQAEINNIFSFVDCRIESTEKSLNNLLLLKKALLQQLFI